MALGKEIKVVLSLDDDGFRVGIRDASGNLKQFEQAVTSTAKSVSNIEHGLNSFGAKAHTVIATMGMARFALMDLRDIFLSLPLSILKTSGEIERLQKLMEGLSKQTDETKRKLEAAANVKFLFNMAQNSPFEVKALSDAFVKLKTGGIDPTNGSLKALVDSVAKFGGDSELLKRAAIAIQQMGGKGVVSMEELRQQLGEAVPTAMQAMADGMGITMAELTKKVSKGTVGAQVAVAKMLAVMSIENAGAAAKMMDTWTGMLEQLKTKWELFKLDMGQQGMFDEAKKAVKDLLDAFNGNESGSLARSIGQGLNDAVVSVVAITKKLVEMSDTIILVGKAWATYWTASKIAATSKRISDSINSVRLSILQKRDAAQQAATDEITTSQRKAESDIARFQERIRQNEQEIAAERARVAAAKQAYQEKLAAEIQANNLEVAAARDKAAELAAIEQEIRMRSMATALEAEKIARSKRAGSGADSRRMTGDAMGLAGNADLLANERQALLNNAAAIEKRNLALQGAAEMSAISTSATNENIAALTAQNNALRQVIVQHEAAAVAIGETNTAMSATRLAATSAIGWLKNMVFSMNGLVIAITAGIWAWEHFSAAAEKAAHDAKVALNFADMLRRGAVTKEDNASLGDTISDQEERLSGIRTLIAQLDSKRKLRESRGLDTSMIDKEIQQAKNTENGILAALQSNQDNQVAGLKQVMERDAERAAQEIADEVRSGADKIVEKYEKANQEIAEKLSSGDKLSPAQQDALAKQKRANDEAALAAQKEYLREQLKNYDQMAKDASQSKDKAATYADAVKLLNKQIEDVNKQIYGLTRADQNFAGNKKGPKTKPTDSVLSRLRSEQLAVLRAKQLLESMKSDVTDIGLLREQARQEVEQMIADDPHVKQVHTREQEDQLVEALTNKKVLLAAVQQMREIRKKIPKMVGDVNDLEHRAATGDTNAPQNKAENELVARLRTMADSSVEARLALRELEPEIEKLKNLTARKDLAQAEIDDEKRLKDLRISTIVNTRERVAAEGQRELDDIQRRYDQQVEMAMKNGLDVQTVLDKRAEEIRLHNLAVANSLKTPLQKLAEDWRDGIGQMQDATKRWSENFLDTFSKMLTTGRGDWRTFLAGMLTDVMNANLKKSFGDKITSSFDGIGNWISQKFGIGAKTPPAPGATGAVGAVVSAVAPTAAGVAQDAAAGALSKLGKAGAVATNAMVSVSTQGLAQMATSTLMAAVQTTGKMTIEQAAAVGIAQMGLAAQAAAAALMQVAASSGAKSSAGIISHFFANGGIMSSLGSLPLRKYANGGIANSPQLAVFGEGSMTEAYVPLPDGHSIPVTLKGAQQAQGTGVVISIVVNEADGSAKTAASGDDRGTWTRIADRVKGVVREELVKESRPGGVLYNK